MNNILICAWHKTGAFMSLKNIVICGIMGGLFLVLSPIACSASLDPYHDTGSGLDLVVVFKASEGPYDLVPVEVNKVNIDSISWVTLDANRAEVLELPPGLSRLFVKNEGILTHDMHIVGEGIEMSTRNIGPRRTAEVELYLLEGTYKIYCDIKNHRQKSKDITLHVKDGITYPTIVSR